MSLNKLKSALLEVRVCSAYLFSSLKMLNPTLLGSLQSKTALMIFPLLLTGRPSRLILLDTLCQHLLQTIVISAL